jgi:hypothetical protein
MKLLFHPTKYMIFCRKEEVKIRVRVGLFPSEIRGDLTP